MMSVCVDPKQVHKVWPHVKEGCKRAIARNGISSFEALGHRVLDGTALLWLATDGQTIHGVAVTELYTDYCEITAFSTDDLKAILPLIKDLEQFARDEKCKAMRIVGPRAWQRLLPGYEPKAVIMERPL